MPPMKVVCVGAGLGAPTMNGMAFGNLFLAALTQQEGSFLRAVEEDSRLLGLRGRVLP